MEVQGRERTTRSPTPTPTSATPSIVSGSRSRPVFGRVPDRAVEVVAGVVVAVAAGVVEVVVDSRDGAVGLIGDDDVDVGPLASAPAGMDIETPIQAMAAANLNDFTGLDNVVEHWISVRLRRLVRCMHVFSCS
ncbi:MAG TPA: hypothetical protein VHV75_16290 [Solirubrobacteraceae bacterium]|nr:hypothetical protein [Solirubrobacteraceae bacterium]